MIPAEIKTHQLSISYPEYLSKFKKLLASLGLNNSTQRNYVLKLFFESSEHLNAEDIMFQLKEKFNVNIGIATVYRILLFLENMKIIVSLNLENTNSKRYELNLKMHHDHLVCNICGAVSEFYNNELEKIQESIAKDNNFELTNHHMILYGICEKCKKQ